MSGSDTDVRRIKRATAQLFKSVGGLKVVAAHLDKSIPVVGRYEETAGEAFGRFIKLPDLVEIEAIAPRPLVTELLCRMAGGVFVPNVDTTADEGSAGWLVMQLSKELGDVSGQIATALADDGGIDAVEAVAALEQLNDLDAMSRRLRALLTRIASDGEREGAAQHG